MGPINYLNLSAVFGFFVGLFISILKVSDPAMMLFWVMAMTMVFYLFGLFFVSMYLKVLPAEKQNFSKSNIEQKINEITERLNAKESDLKSIKEEIKVFNFEVKSK